jgi:hypothetical protein
MGLPWLALILLALAPLPVAPARSADLPAAGRSPLRHVNGELPLGTVTAAAGVERLMRMPAGPGYETLIYRTTRLPGTRAPIHFHDHGGITCVLQGETTLRIEGKPPQRHVAGACFAMPAGVAMANLNSGTIPAVMLDVFTVPLGGAVWRPVEPEHLGPADQYRSAP